MMTALLSNAEWKVMNVVWDLGDPITARRVLDAVANDSDWAYTTVKTMLDRLVEKGVLSAERTGRQTQYRAQLQRGAARRSATRALIGRAFEGAAGLMAHELVRSERLSASDRDRLRRLLDAQETEERDASRDENGSLH